MKNLKILMMVTFFVIISMTGCSSPTDSPMSGNQEDEYSSLIGISSANPNPTKSGDEDSLFNGLKYMREEEKLARDIYQKMHAKWGLIVFRNISKSEDAHSRAMLYLLNLFSIPDPVGSNGVGVFTDLRLQNLYNSLLAKGNTSVTEALKTGALIEEVDILDIRHELTLYSDPSVLRVYNNLMHASYAHLKAFVFNLKRYGITYSPQYLTQQEYEEIINS